MEHNKLKYLRELLIYSLKKYRAVGISNFAKGNSAGWKKNERGLWPALSLLTMWRCMPPTCGIFGRKKPGKTVLCHKVIERDNLIEFSGSHINTVADFWLQIAETLLLPAEV